MTSTRSEDIASSFLDTIYTFNYILTRRIKFQAPGSHLMMLTLLSHHGPMTATDISQLLNMSKQQVVSITNKMISSESLEKHPLAADRRSYLISITDTGYKILDHAKEQVIAFFDKEINLLTDDKQRELLYATKSLNSLMNELLLSSSKDELPSEKKLK